MVTELEFLIAFFVLFLVVFCAFESFDRLSGGLIHKLEEEDELLAEKFSCWLDHSDSIRAVFKLILFILITLMGVFSYLVVRRIYDEQIPVSGLLVVVSAVIVSWATGELISKLILYRFDIPILKRMVPPVYLLSRTILLPITFLAEKARENALEWRNEEAPEQKVSVEDEILSFVDNCNEETEDDLEEGEKRMIKGILDMGDMLVKEIMTPRVDIKALSVKSSIADAKALFIESGHSRIPVYGRSIDEIKGIIYAKDFIDEKKTAGKNLEKMLHIPIFVPESKEVGSLLEEFKRLHNHFAVIIDEYGGTSGIITFEDIIEEIIGDVQDEFDTEEGEKLKAQLMPDGSIVMEGRTLVADVNEMMDSEIPEIEDADTIGGYISCELGRIPEKDEVYHFRNCPLKAKVLEADERKIQLLRLYVEEEGREDAQED